MQATCIAVVNPFTDHTSFLTGNLTLKEENRILNYDRLSVLLVVVFVFSNEESCGLTMLTVNKEELVPMNCLYSAIAVGKLNKSN